MKTITTNDTMGKSHTYEIVEKIPYNFFIWNIGANMGHDEYIPLAEDLHPENKNDCTINIDTVKAIKLNKKEVELLRCAAHCGIVSKAAAEKALRSKRNGYLSNHKREEAKKTIDIFNRITA